LLDLLATGTPLVLAGPTMAALRPAGRLLEAAGVLPGPVTPRHETRVRPGPGGAAVATRLGGDLCLVDRWPLVDKVADDVAVLLTASWQLRDTPVATLRPGAVPVATLSLGGEPAALGNREVARLVHRVVRAAAGLADGPPVRVGMLGYGAVGGEHAAAIAALAGLTLTAVCDRNPERLAAGVASGVAGEVAGGEGHQVRGFTDPEQLLTCPEVDLIIVSTPPNSHAGWALRVLESGRSVLVEKPFAITVAEVDAVLAAAQSRGLVAASYQNRRFDPDYLALAGAVRDGLVGEVFAYDSFVGGYGHPCNYWHSDAAVSGGALYDWGSHYLDWMLDLFAQPVRSVRATAHKRVWLDVTNADHSRVSVRFEGGLEAEFVHSELAAALPPKWHLLGTAGAIRGDWRAERVVARTLVGTLDEDRLAPAESPAEITLFRPEVNGGVHRTQLALPVPPLAPLHRDLADTVLTGLPGRVRVEQSRRVIALLEAATRSAARDGATETPEVR
ncbi:MAG: Gfo/Idh/MocA family protein, partial [Mycobacteriales bacterium]